METLFVSALWLVVAAGIYVVTTRQARDQARAIQLAVQAADSLRQSADSARVTAIQAQYAAKSAGQRERKAAGALTAQLDVVRDSLDALRQIEQDSAASLDSVRQALKGAIHLADTLSIQVSIYMAAVDTLRDKHAEERRAMTVALEKADTALAHQDALIRALRKQTECRVLGMRCPSRGTIAVTGLMLGALLTR
jgi:small-conductance mechanosensitive channel